jgi:hypothetical protein
VTPFFDFLILFISSRVRLRIKEQSIIANQMQTHQKNIADRHVIGTSAVHRHMILDLPIG